VIVGDANVTGLEWNVTDGLAVRGVVLDESGAPVENARLHIFVSDGVVSDSTNKDGTFALTGLVPGKYQIDVNVTRGPSVVTDVTVGSSDLTDVKIVIPNGGAIDGSVVDEDGAPVAGVEVDVSGNDGGASTTTRDDGTFTTQRSELRPGSYRVSVARNYMGLRAPGETGDGKLEVPATVKAGQTTHVKLKVEREKGVIRGNVVDSSGKPVTDAFVAAQRESESPAASESGQKREMQWLEWGREPALTDQDGKFMIDKLADGSYFVRAYRRGGGDAIVEHIKIGATVTITIPTTGSIAGTVVAADGASPDEVEVQVRNRKVGFERTERFFRTHGVFAMRDLPAGDFDVSATALEGDALAAVSLGDGEHKEGVTLTLVARAHVRGQVLSLDDGTPVAGMTVTLWLPHSNAQSKGSDDHELTDATGHYEISDAPTGRAYVWAAPKDYSVGPFGVSVAVATINPGENELPPLKVPRRRMEPSETAGDLGFTLKQWDEGDDPERHSLLVAIVRPGGPAAVAGLHVGDVIVEVDGHDVTGLNVYTYETFASISPGASITLGLASGGKVTITAGKEEK
jgi:protocatechuate 3,4-dioxygenase beta subunit